MGKFQKIGVEHYYSFPSTYSYEKKKEKLDIIVNSNQYIYSLKTDGNFARVVIEDDFRGLQTRGISTVTKERLEIQDRVLFWNDINRAFTKETCLLGEVYFENGIDRNVSGVLRMKPHKALSVQDKEYYSKALIDFKFTPKDRRDVELNDFFGIPLRFRIFDVLAFEGLDLSNAPMEQRVQFIPEAVKQIGSPLVTGVRYYNCEPETFYDNLDKILNAGGEGVVLVRKDSKYEPEAKSARAWKTLKCKRELQETVDAFITGLVPATKEYTGKKVETCQYWENTRTGELLYGDYFNAYALGENLIPVSKGYYNGWPGAIVCSVFDKNGNIIPIANVAGLPEALKEELKENFCKYQNAVVTISGMMISEGAKTNSNSGYSVRHPRLVGFRSDIPIEDCTLEKIIRE